MSEWRAKLGEVQAELERSLSDGRSTSAECFRTKSQIEEASSSIDALRRENKNLSGRLNCHKMSIESQYRGEFYGDVIMQLQTRLTS